MLCEKCGEEVVNITCCHCGSSILPLGSFCYVCGKTHTATEPVAEDGPAGEIDFANRVLCSDGACIGVVDEKGVCKVCGKPYVPESQ